MDGSGHRDTGNTETLFSYAEGEVTATDLGDGRRRVRLVPASDEIYVHRSSTDTSYDDELLSTIVPAKGFGFLCDEINRDQDPNYLERHLVATISSHVDPAEFAGGRVLDFGCGAGASTSILGRLLPDSDIVGIELEEPFLAVARERARFYHLANVEFQLSPSPDHISPELGQFDAVVLSAVFEHLLPDERLRLMPELWGAVKPGGYLFIDETPWRWFPIETHTTGIPMLNYLPARAAQRLAARKPKLRGRTDWGQLQRAGIRGGTTREIVRSLGDRSGQAEVLQPSRAGVDNWVDLWFEGYASGGSGRFPALKRSARGGLKFVQRATGISAVPYLSLAIRKRA